MEKLPGLKYSDQLILTTNQLAAFYNAKTDTLMQNFRRNASKFKEGTDFFHLKGNALKEFKSHLTDSQLVDKRTASLYLWTKRGASRHSKMLGSDRAWDMYDELQDNYFRPQVQVPKLTATEQIKLQNQAIVEMDIRMKHVEDNMRISCQQEYEIHKNGQDRVKQILGGKESRAYQDRTLRSEVYRQFWSSFNHHFCIPRYGALPRIKFDEAMQYLLIWLPDTAIQHQISEYRIKTIIQGGLQNAIEIS